MRIKRGFLVGMIIFVVMFLLVSSGFSQGKMRTKIYSGEIEWVSRDFKYIGINEHKVLVTPETKVVGEDGKILKISDLKPRLYATVELIRNPDGSTEKRIVIRK